MGRKFGEGILTPEDARGWEEHGGWFGEETRRVAQLSCVRELEVPGSEVEIRRLFGDSDEPSWIVLRRSKDANAGWRIMALLTIEGAWEDLSQEDVLWLFWRVRDVHARFRFRLLDEAWEALHAAGGWEGWPMEGGEGVED